MNGLKDFGMYGQATQAAAHSALQEGTHRPGRTTGERRPSAVRFRVGRGVVIVGSRIMGRRIELPDFDRAQPA